jgi:hypothetical protein
MELADNRGYFGFSDFGYLPLLPKFTSPIIRIDKRWRNHRSLVPAPTVAVSLWV